MNSAGASRDDDQRVVLAVRAGDADAFGELVRRYQSRLFNLCLTVLREREGAEEIAQDAFVTAFRKLACYDDRRPFYPWLATIAVRLARNRLRRKQLEFSQGDSDDFASPGRNPEELLEREEDKAIWERVFALPPGERTAVFLVYRQELTMSEAARAIGVTEGTVKTLLFRARRRLRDVMVEKEENEG